MKNGVDRFPFGKRARQILPGENLPKTDPHCLDSARPGPLNPSATRVTTLAERIVRAGRATVAGAGWFNRGLSFFY